MNSPFQPYSKKRLLCIWLPAFFISVFSFHARSQSSAFFAGRFARFLDKCPIESVYLHLDKYECMSGDSIWWKGYVFTGTESAAVSTNLYVELFTEHGQLISQKLFPIVQSFAAGQIAIPDSLQSGRYFLRAYTRYQTNFDSLRLFTAPLTVFNPRDPKPLPVAERLDVESMPTMTIKDNLQWISSSSNDALYCLLEADSSNKYLNIPLHVVVMSYHRPYCHATLTLTQKNLWQDFTLACKDLDGYVDLLLWADTNLIARQTLFIPQKHQSLVKLTADTLDVNPNGYNSWAVHIEDSLLYNCSVAVTDADRTEPAPFDINNAVNPDPLDYGDLLAGNFPTIRFLDSAYLTWKGTISKPSGKKYHKRELITVISSKSPAPVTDTRIMPINEKGEFEIDHAFFFDTATMQFQINHASSDQAVQLSFAEGPASPSFAYPINKNWKDSVAPIDVKSQNVVTSIQGSEKIRVLDTFLLQKKKGFREELDKKYATGVFAEPALFSFDVRSEDRYHELVSFLQAHIPGFAVEIPADTPSFGFKKSPVIFYVDEQILTWDDLRGYNIDDMAYIKAFLGEHWFGETPFMHWKTGYKGGSLMPVTPNADPKLLKLPVDDDPLIVCIYLKKEDDRKMSQSRSSNSMALQGYVPPLAFKGNNKNGWTLFWNPIIESNNYRIQFRNSAHSKRFRICVEGVNGLGRVIRYEEVLSIK